MGQPKETLPFVIQEHTGADGTHWDLMLEMHQALATWQVPTEPANWSTEETTCRRLGDHRLAYLTYEGPISKNRGSVQIKCRGEYEPIRVERDHWEVRLMSETITGRLELRSTGDDQWQLTLRRQ